MHFRKLLYGCCALRFAKVGVSAEPINLVIPDAPPPGTQIIDGSFQGYSMEMASFVDFTGNSTSPNRLSIQLLQNLKKLTGSATPIRVGGTTANHATWIPNQQEAIVLNYETPGADQPANISLGLNYLDSFKTFPAGTQYTVGLTFNSGTKGKNKTLEEAAPFYESLGESLYALEVGNEFDVLPVDRNQSSWSIQQYVSEWLDRTSAITKQLLRTGDDQRFFQAGVFTAPGTMPNVTTWTAEKAIDLGILSTEVAKTFSTHQYFGYACGFEPTLIETIMNRSVLTHYMQYHENASAYTVSKGLPYVLGETNSIACQGFAGVSDVFGAALWSIDYALYAASLNVSRIYWHMGTGYRYSAWQGIQNGTTAPGPRPLYYGNLFINAALGGADKQVVPIVNTSTLAGYAVYSAAYRQQSARLEQIVLVNMDLFDSSATRSDQRPSARFELPDNWLQEGKRVRVRRLTAAGAEVKEGITFASQTVAQNGTIIGEANVKKLEGHSIEVKASEAVLLSFGS